MQSDRVVRGETRAFLLEPPRVCAHEIQDADRTRLASTLSAVIFLAYSQGVPQQLSMQALWTYTPRYTKSSTGLWPSTERSSNLSPTCPFLRPSHCPTGYKRICLARLHLSRVWSSRSFYLFSRSIKPSSAAPQNPSYTPLHLPHESSPPFQSTLVSSGVTIVRFRDTRSIPSTFFHKTFRVV